MLSPSAGSTYLSINLATSAALAPPSVNTSIQIVFQEQLVSFLPSDSWCFFTLVLRLLFFLSLSLLGISSLFNYSANVSYTTSENTLDAFWQMGKKVQHKKLTYYKPTECHHLSRRHGNLWSHSTRLSPLKCTDCQPYGKRYYLLWYHIFQISPNINYIYCTCKAF